MQIDSFSQIWKRVETFVPAGGALMAQRWTVDAFRRISERRRWSYLVKYNQFILPAAYVTGTVTVTQGSTTITGIGTTFTPAMVGRQFRLSSATPIYTIAQYNSATSLELQFPWGGTTQTAGYQIYLCYLTPPSDFHAFISVWDPNFNWQLRLNIQQEELNSWDAQRANTGQAYLLASYDYSQNQVGTVSAPVQIAGSGPSPAIAGDTQYTGAANAVFTIQITTGGVDGTAVFQWKKNSGAFTTGVVTDAGGGEQALSDGINIYFPTGATYVLNDTWVIQAFVQNSSGIPRYELWPHNLANYVYPFLYEARAQDLDEPGAVLPRFIRGDVVMDVALAMAAKWPGPSVDQPNPYFDLTLADRLERRNEQMIGELERQDDETYMNMVNYQASMPFNPWWDANYIQRHDL